MVPEEYLATVASAADLSAIFEQMVRDDIPYVSVFEQGQFQGILARAHIKGSLIRFAARAFPSGRGWE